jgi:hypothetical protein
VLAKTALPKVLWVGNTGERGLERNAGNGKPSPDHLPSDALDLPAFPLDGMVSFVGPSDGGVGF